MADEYHEPWEELTEEDRNLHRGLKSLQEELEAIDWYGQRASVCGDLSLKEIILHNRDEEMEHAAMLLEWLRRKMPGWEKPLRTFLFTEEPILQLEERLQKREGAAPVKNAALFDRPSDAGTKRKAAEAPAPAGGMDLGIGDMKEEG